MSAATRPTNNAPRPAISHGRAIPAGPWPGPRAFPGGAGTAVVGVGFAAEGTSPLSATPPGSANRPKAVQRRRSAQAGRPERPRTGEGLPGNGRERKRSGNPRVAAPFKPAKNTYFFSATAAFSLEPAVSLTLWPAAIWMVSPVCGLRPVRAARSVRSTASQPGMVIFFARGDRGLEDLEQCVEHGVDCCLAGAGLACYLCNKFTTVLSHLCPPGRS